MNSVVYHGDLCLGQLTVIPLSNQDFHFPDNVIRIHHLSPLSDRCLPLSILHTISSFPILCKLESPISSSEQPHLINLHASCFHCLQTAVVLGRDRNEEVHLVAMPSRQKNFPCFWCFSAPCGLYLASLRMLNMRSLAIVFDLDETLIVANTMKSFEDRIEALRAWIAREVDPVRVAGMSLELRRYADDRAMLRQFSEFDYAMDNGKMHRAQLENFHPLSGSQEGIVRPVIRLPDKHIVLTRINPEIRDTSVFVRLRPAWEDLRCYLTAKGRRRFEVYVCTMAERDYALEMWRLLDPEAQLIDTEKILDRVVCVKSGCRKSLLNVFQDGICHPRMAMVIDDRINVWEENDQTRVHVVPPFTPYYSPQAEFSNVVPVLCVARNVSCDVRGGFFRAFDENFLRQVVDIHYEDDTTNMPPAPDVGNYLVTEETCSVPNDIMDGATSDTTIGGEFEWKSTQSNGMNVTDAPKNPLATCLDRPAVSNMNIAGVLGQAPSQTTQSSWRQDSIIPDFDSDPKRKFGLSKHGHDMQNKNPVDLTFFSRVSSQHASTASVQQQERSSSQNQASSNPKVLPNSLNMSCSTFSADVLREIGRRCGSKVEFRSAPSIGPQMQLSMEVFFSGEKIGFGVGKTVRYAQQQAAHNGLQCLAAKYREYIGPGAVVDTDFNKISLQPENGFVWGDVPLSSSDHHK